jgi:ATP/maltotriose-dependent transcriptional regulator MalT
VSTGSFQAAFLNVLAVVEAYVGEYRLALNHVDDCLSRCERSGYGFLRPAAEDVRGQILLAMGRTADGSATIRAAAEAPELANDDFSRCLCLSHLGTSARRMGDLGEAMNYYDQALAMNRTGPTPYASLTAQSNREYTRLLCDRDLPLVSLRNSRDGATASGLLFVAAKCDFFESVVLAERGECKPALSLLTRAVDAHLMYGHIHFLSQELMAFPELALEFLSSLANAALIAGSLDALARHHDSLPLMLKALTLSEETALGVLKASAQHLNDENWRVLAGRARRHRSPAVRRAAADLSASRLPMDKGLTPDLPELTAREREVLRLIADGLRNADISQRLYLSPGTVKTYVNRIFSKLGVQDRVHAVLYYKDQVGR